MVITAKYFKETTKEMQQNQNQEVSVFEVIQQQFNIVTVAQDILGLRLKKCGKTFRANSLAPDGGGENALEIHEDTNSFYDWKLEIGGDITQLVATAKFNGSISDAIKFLMPDFYSKDHAKIERELKARRDFAKQVDSWHEILLRPNEIHSKLARQYLLDRGFTLDTIKALKIGLTIEPFDGNPEPRIVFPYWNKTGSEVIYYTTRKFPSMRKQVDGKYIEDEYVEDEITPKYKKASLTRYPFLRNAPMGLNTLNRNRDKTGRILVITEGVCDWLAFYQEGYSVISPNGGGDEKFWNEVIKEAEEFCKVLLAFDNDDAGRNFTYKAAQFLMKNDIPFECVNNLLTKDIAEYYQSAGNLDAIMNSSQNGLNWIIDSLKRPEPFESLSTKLQKDLLAKCREILAHIAVDGQQSQLHEAMLSLRKYFPKEIVSELMKSAKNDSKEDAREKKKNEIAEAVNWITTHHTLIHDPRVGFYEYNQTAGRWEHKTDENIGGYIVQYFGDKITWQKIVSVRNTLKNDRKVDSDSPVKKFNTLPLMSFINGTLHINIETGEVELKPHSPNDYNTVRLPYIYNPKAKADNWLKFIDDITAGNKEAQATLQEFPGYALLPHNIYQKCLLLKGGGANGKSVYTDVISAAFGGIGEDGRGYVSHVEPGKFREQFRLMPFMYSFLNVSSDTETDLKGAEGVFKRIVAGEILEDSYKFRDNVQFATRTKLMMCCNNFPVTGDTSEGFMRRFLVVEFPRHYVDNPRPRTNERKIDYTLKAKLLNEIQGIFNWIIQGMQRLIKQGGFTKSLREEKLLREFRTVNNHVFAFVEENMHIFFNEDSSGKRINKRDIFRAYIAWCEGEYIQPISAHRFYSNLRGVLSSYAITFIEKGLIWTFDDDPNKMPEQEQTVQNAQEDTQTSTQETVQEVIDTQEQLEQTDDWPEDWDKDDEPEYDPQYLRDPEEELGAGYDDDDLDRLSK